MAKETWKDTKLCDHCGIHTLHEFYDAGHERDSSHNRETCMVCGYYRLGMSDRLWEPHLTFREGDIAICKAGFIGLITCDGKRLCHYPDGNSAMAYVGIHLENRKGVKIGAPWSSTAPEPVTSTRRLRTLTLGDEHEDS
jgi:hypothetical protein